MATKFTIAWFLVGLVVLGVTESPAHNSYTGGYSGAPGRQICASSCHSSSAGTLTVSGFPSVYDPGRTYTITIKHSSGSKIINFNATTRIGSTTTVAGTFGAGTSSALFTSADGGVYAGTHLVDSANFQWTAPLSGTGSVNFYCAGMQGTSTGSSSGQTTKITLTASENPTGVKLTNGLPKGFELLLNYPNPFNPSTRLTFGVPQRAQIRLTVYNALGETVAELVNGEQDAGYHEVQFEARGLSSGAYFCRLQAGDFVQTKRIMLLK